MNTAKKAALFSAFLLPGWGQLYLKKYKRGLAIMLPFIAVNLALAWVVVQVAIAIIKATPFKKGTVQFNDVLAVTVKSIKAMDLVYLAVILTLIVLLWIFSIVDAYLLGKKEMQTTAAPKESI